MGVGRQEGACVKEEERGDLRGGATVGGGYMRIHVSSIPKRATCVGVAFFV